MRNAVSIVVGDRMFGRCKILILPKSNHFRPNFALILPKFRTNPTKFAQILTNFAQKNFVRKCGRPAPYTSLALPTSLIMEI